MEKSDIKILVVDDNAVIRQSFTTILEEQGYQVITATDGDEALGMVLELPPDLIFLDVVMPNMDGFQTLEKLRRMRKTKKIPVIMVTGRTDTTTLIKALKMGANDFIAKPFVKSDVSRKMGFVLMNRRQQKRKTESALLQEDTSTFIHGRSFQHMQENFILNFEHIYLSMVKMISNHQKHELKRVTRRLLNSVKFYKFQTPKEKTLQMLVAIVAGDWDKAIELLEEIYQIFQEMRHVNVPPAN